MDLPLPTDWLASVEVVGAAVTLGSSSGYDSGITRIDSPVGTWVEVSRGGLRSGALAVK